MTYSEIYVFDILALKNAFNISALSFNFSCFC